MKKILLILAFFGFAFFAWQIYHKKVKEAEKYVKQETFAKYINLETLKGKIKKETPSWMKEQIQEDFAEFSASEFSKSNVDETFKTIKKNYNSPWVIRYRIVNNELYRYFPEGEAISSEDTTIELALKTLLYFFDLKDFDFIIAYDDGIPLSPQPKGFYLTDVKDGGSTRISSASSLQFCYFKTRISWCSMVFQSA